MWVQTVLRKWRSWLTTMTVPSKSSRKSSSQLTDVDIQVVGRLVQQQDIRVAEQGLGQQHLDLLTGVQGGSCQLYAPNSSADAQTR